MKDRLERILAPLQDEFETLEISSSMSVEDLRKTLLEKLNQNHKNRALCLSIHGVLIKLANEFPLREECLITFEAIDFKAEPPIHVCLSTGEAYNKDALINWIITKSDYVSPLTRKPLSRLDRRYLQNSPDFPYFCTQHLIPYQFLLPEIQTQIASPFRSNQRNTLIDIISPILNEYNHDVNERGVNLCEITNLILSRIGSGEQVNQDSSFWKIYHSASLFLSFIMMVFKQRVLGSDPISHMGCCSPDFTVEMAVCECFIRLTVFPTTDALENTLQQAVSNGPPEDSLFSHVDILSADPPAADAPQSTPPVRFSQSSDRAASASQPEPRSSFRLS